MMASRCACYYLIKRYKTKYIFELNINIFFRSPPSTSQTGGGGTYFGNFTISEFTGREGRESTPPLLGRMLNCENIEGTFIPENKI